MDLPVPRRRFYSVEYWQCTIDGHRHISKDNALRCIEKQSRPRRKLNPWNINKDAVEDVLLLRETGLTYKLVGEKYNVSAGRARELCNWAKRRREWKAQHEN